MSFADIRIALSNGDKFTNAREGDMIVYTEHQDQDMLFGTSTESTLRITKDCVHISGASNIALLQVVGKGNDTSPLISTCVGTSNIATHIEFCNASNVVCGSITTMNGGTQYTTLSDYRIKENVKPIRPSTASSLIRKMNPITYNILYDSVKMRGFLAHELQEIVAEAVCGEKDGDRLQVVDYGRITPILVSAIQDILNRLDYIESSRQFLT